MFECMHACMCVCVGRYVLCMYACVCMFVCMHACSYVYVHVCIACIVYVLVSMPCACVHVYVCLCAKVPSLQLILSCFFQDEKLEMNKT